MRTQQIHLRVLDKYKKSKFSHYSITDVPDKSIEELRQFLLREHATKIAPAATTADLHLDLSLTMVMNGVMARVTPWTRRNIEKGKSRYSGFKTITILCYVLGFLC